MEQQALTTIKKALKGLFLQELLLDEGWAAYVDLLLRNISYADLQLLRTNGFPYGFDLPSYVYKNGVNASEGYRTDIFTIIVDEKNDVLTITYDPGNATYKLDFAPIDVFPVNMVGVTVQDPLDPKGEPKQVWSELTSTPYFTFDPSLITTFTVRASDVTFNLVPYRLPEQLDPAAINEAVYEQAAYLDPLTPPTSPQALFGLIARLLRGKDFSIWYQFADGPSYTRKTFPDYVKYHLIEQDAIKDDRAGALTMWTDAPVPIDALRDRFGTGTALSRIIGYDKQYLVVENNAPAPNYIPLIADYVPNILSSIDVHPNELALPQRSGKWRLTTPAFEITKASYDVFTQRLTFAVDVGCAPSQRTAVQRYRLWVYTGDTFLDAVETRWVSGQTTMSGEFVLDTDVELFAGAPLRVECALLPSDDDSYWYASDLAEDNAEVTLSFAKIILAQSGVSSGDATEWNATLEWSSPGDFSSYVLQYRAETDTAWISLSPTTSKTATVTLKQITEYVFRVLGRNSGYEDVLSNEVIVAPPDIDNPAPDIIWEFETETWENRQYPMTRLTIKKPSDPAFADRTYTAIMNDGPRDQYSAGVISPYKLAEYEPFPGIYYNYLKVIGNPIGIYGASENSGAVLVVNKLLVPEVSYDATSRLLTYSSLYARRYTVTVNGTTYQDTEGRGRYQVPEFEGILTITVVAHALYYLSSDPATINEQSSQELQPSAAWIYNKTGSDTTLTVSAPQTPGATFKYRWGKQNTDGVAWRINYTAITEGAHPGLIVIPPTETGIWVAEVVTEGKDGQQDSAATQSTLTSSLPAAVNLKSFNIDYAAKTMALEWHAVPNIESYEVTIVGTEGVVSDFSVAPTSIELGQRASDASVRLTAIGLYRGNWDINQYPDPISVVANPINDKETVDDTQYNIPIPDNYWGAEISIFVKPIAGFAINDYEYLCAVDGQGTEIVGRTLIVDDLSGARSVSTERSSVALRMRRSAPRIAAAPEAPLVAAPAAGRVNVVTTPPAAFDIRPIQVIDNSERFVLLADEGKPFMLYAPESTLPLPAFGITKIYQMLSLLTDGILSGIHIDIHGTEGDLPPAVLDALQDALEQGVKPGVKPVVSFSYPNIGDEIDVTDEMEQETAIKANPEAIQLNQRGSNVATVQITVMPAGRPFDVKVE